MNDLMTKSFMSYVDLKKEAMKDLEAGPDYDLEMSSNASTMDQNLGLFLEEAEKIKQEMAVIRELLGKLQESNEESKSLHKQESLKALRNKINNDIVTVQKKARTIKAQLEEMDRANATNKRLSGCKEGTLDYRTRIAVTNGLRNKLKELMMDFQGLRQKMMTEYKETVGRRYFTVTGENPDEEIIEKIISDGNGGEGFLTRAIQEHGRGKVLETVVEIQDRHDAAKEIEKSLLELHQVFLDMAVMVEAQGEQMDDIEHHVMNASHYVKDGSKELNTAKQTVSRLTIHPHRVGYERSFYNDFGLRGIRVDKVEPGFVSCTFKVPPRLTDKNGNLATGAIANIVDEVGGSAVFVIGVPMKVSVDMSISFLGAAKLGDELEITSKALGERGGYAGTLVHIRNKATGELIAEGRHSLYGNESSKLLFGNQSSKL